MSYCRWSSDNFACDLYCYESADGYETHVATHRYVGEIPRLPPLPMQTGVTGLEIERWVEASNAQLLWLDRAEHVAIGGPFDGQSFTDDLQGFRDRLITLRAAGYRFPEYALEAVEEEIAEGKNA